MLMGRNPNSLQVRRLTLMVSHGLLKLKYPNAPRRVEQAYKAIERSKRIELLIDFEV